MDTKQLTFRSWLVSEAGKDRSGVFSIRQTPFGLLHRPQSDMGDLYGSDKDQIHQLGQQKQSGVCISGFKRHASVINAFAQQSPENMAQTIMFASLTANRNFTTVFGYFPVLVSVLRHGFKSKSVNPVDLWHIALGISKQFPEIKMLLNSDSAYYASNIWNRRQEIYETLMAFNKRQDYVNMLDYLKNLKSGMSDVKGAFAIQLCFGTLACLDAHNIRVYTRLAGMTGMKPDKVSDIENAMNLSGKDSTARYVDAVQSIMTHFGLTSQHFWDIWNDYVVRQPDSLGKYNPAHGPALNPFDDTYQQLLHVMQKSNKPMPKIITGDWSGMAGSKAHLAAATRGAEDFHRNLKPGEEEWRDSVLKFAHEKHPAYTLAQLITSPAGIESLKKAGEGMTQQRSAVPQQQSFGGLFGGGQDEQPINYLPPRRFRQQLANA